MRVLLLCYEFPPLGGGGSRVCEGLARALVADGHEVVVVTSRFSDLPRFETVAGVHVRRVSTLRRRVDRSDPIELTIYAVAALLVLLRERPHRAADVCHVHFVFPDGLVAWVMRRLVGLRYLLTAHGSDVPGYNPTRFVRLHVLLRPVWRRVVQEAEQIVCASNGLAALVRRADATRRPAILPNGLDPHRLRPAPVKTRGILCVARLFRRKGIHHLLASAAAEDLGVPLHLVGDGPDRAALELQALNSRTRIIFHGWLDNTTPELRQLYETLAIFILPSTAENFPVCLLEAMAAGMAIVTTGDTGCAEVVGNAAILVPSGDPAAIRAALERLVSNDDLRFELGCRARDRFERLFTWQTVARRHVELYETLRAQRAVKRLTAGASP